MKKIFCTMATALTLLLGSMSADPVSWTVISGPVNGSFVYDADTPPGDYSGINLVETFFSDNYTGNVVGGSDSNGFSISSNFFGDFLTVLFDQALTNAGGTIGFSGTVECFTACGVSQNDSYNFAGTVSSVAQSVPEPTTFGLLVAGIVLTGFARRRRQFN